MQRRRLVAVTLFSACVLQGCLVFPTAHAANCAKAPKSEKARYTTTKVNLRSYPGTYGSVYTTLPPGQIVYAYRTSDGWSQVNVASMNIAEYVASRYLTSDCVSAVQIGRIDLSSAAISNILISQSKSRYRGSCPCPNNFDRGGRQCGARSAYSRPGGKSPLFNY